MINARRMIIAGDKSFENCQLYTSQEQQDAGHPNLFEHNQMVFRDSHKNRYIIPNYVITYIELGRRVAPPPDSVKAIRIILSSDISFAPAWVLKDFRQHDIPDLFGYPFQFAFVADKKIYITTDVNIIMVQLT